MGSRINRQKRLAAAVGVAAAGALGATLLVAAPSNADSADWRVVSGKSVGEKGWYGHVAKVRCPVGFSPVSFTSQLVKNGGFPGPASMLQPELHDTERKSFGSGATASWRELHITWQSTQWDYNLFHMNVQVVCGRGVF